MAGLYIHIPFCKSRCIYCGFYSTVGLQLRQKYVDAVCREMEIRGRRFSACDNSLDTIYLGGGTPSQLTTVQLSQLFQYINKVYGHGAKETTMEMNPDDVTVPYAEALREIGINRVSMGAQTFDDDRLRFLRRRHTVGQVSQAVGILREAGVQNISIDLMYGFPQETLAGWEHDIDTALALEVEHISAYCLIIEENTPLWRLKMKDERLKMPDEETERQMYEMLTEKLTAAGYEHYELSNFARPGYRSRHNSNYWRDIPYVGLGAAAHSYDLKSRSWNVADIHAYLSAVEQGRRPYEEENIDDDTHYNDRITVALRTCEGLDLSELSERHRRYCLQEARRFISDGLLHIDDGRLVLTRKGLFVSDYVMSSLVYV